MLPKSIGGQKQERGSAGSVPGLSLGPRQVPRRLWKLEQPWGRGGVDWQWVLPMAPPDSKGMPACLPESPFA